MIIILTNLYVTKVVFKVFLHFFATSKNFLNLLIPKERLLAVKGGPMPLMFGYVDAFDEF